MSVTTTQLPIQSTCRSYIGKVDFEDAFKVSLKDANMSIEEIYLNIFAYSPKWVGALMILRNKMVGVFGLDTGTEAGGILRENVKVGVKAGVFRIFAITDNELIAGEDDKHLDFRVSVLKQNGEAIISTLVHYNNGFGRIYMSIVMPFHKLVVKAMLQNAVKNGRL